MTTFRPAAETGKPVKAFPGGMGVAWAMTMQDLAEAHAHCAHMTLLPSTTPYPVSKYGSETRSEATKQRVNAERAQRYVVKMEREAALAEAIKRRSFAERLGAHRARKAVAHAE